MMNLPSQKPLKQAYPQRGRAVSLRVAVVSRVGVIVIFFSTAIVFLFVFFLVWLLSKEHIDSYRLIRSG